MLRSTLLPLIVLVATAPLAAADEPITLRVAAWNMEGNGQANAGKLRDQLSAKDGVDLWGLCEVRSDRFDTYLEGAEGTEGTDFEIIKGSTGGPKLRLAIIYDTDVLEQVGDKQELFFAQLGSSGLRAPLVARFRGKRTGQEFFFMVNHLKCCGSGIGKRKQQCKLINEWAEDQEIPVLMCGDLNIPFDTDVGDTQHGPAFDVLTEDGPFIWLRPEHLAKTQASDNFNTVLDYIMVAHPPVENWTFKAHILERAGDDPVTEGDPNDFDDDNTTTDHRPVDVVLTLNATEGGDGEDGEEPGAEEDGDVVARLERLEKSVEELRRMVAELIEGHDH